MSEKIKNNRPKGKVIVAEKSKDFKNSFKRLIKELGVYKWIILVVAILQIIGCIVAVIDPRFLAKLVDEISKSLYTSMNVDAVKKYAIIVILLYIVQPVFNFVASLLIVNLSNNFAKSIRTRVNKKINNLPLRYFDKNQSGDILSRITNDIDTVAQTMNQSFSGLVSSITMFLGSLTMMIYTNYILAGVSVVSSLIGFALMSIILKYSQKYFVSRQNVLGRLNGHIEEAYSGIDIIKTYNAEEKIQNKFDELNEKLFHHNKMAQFLSSIMQPVMIAVGNLGYVGVCVVGALLASKQIITFGVIVAFIDYVRMFTQPLSQIAQSMTSLQQTVASSERIFEFCDEEEMEDESKFNNYLDKNLVKGDIEFENVEFTYSGNNKPTITNFSASIKHGQKIAIVGQTGAGKTTIVNLLMKFYNINKGSIKIDGVDIKTLTRKNIHELFTMVLQDTWIFKGTIKENIVFNRTDITDERVKDICEIIGLEHFIKTLPKGYDSVIESQDTIAEGQKQLLSIARCMVQNTPLLILDEATSNVDTRTEELVQGAMDRLSKGRTSFIIAHRLSTIKNADLILVMNEGNIVEAGTHEELLNKNDVYAKLYNSQFEL